MGTRVRGLNRSFGVRELVLCEGAVAVAAAGAAGGPAWTVPGVAAGAAGVSLVVLRRGGRSVFGWLAVAAAFRARRRRGDSACAGLDRYAYERRRGPAGAREVGMVGDGTFLTAVVRVEVSDAGLRPADGAAELPWDLLAGALEVDDVVLASAQVVQQVRGAAAGTAAVRGAGTAGGTRAGGGAPVVRATWVALRLEPELCPEAVAARGGGPGGAQRCLVRAADQVASRLTEVHGLRATVLDQPGLDSALGAARCGGPGLAVGGEESVRAWCGEGRAHTVYAFGGDPRDAVALAAALPGEAAVAATVSLTLRHRRARGVVGGVGVRRAGAEGHVRVTCAEESELDRVREELARGFRAARLDLVRMDWEQLPGLRATLPLGGAW
ncbi:type VII secretion protein EccE [Streptomyces sp. NPDC088745]|uniref:type VII secretion protein EccE n=1 Tax=Streptomyces sp. NPDC088745 TaxID=3365884 RepID=UPI0037F4C50D